MKKQLLYRNVNAQDNLELFLVSAVSSLLLLRLFLAASSYPQVGGSSLHIAHMLYGGLLMMVAIVLMISFLGRRVQRASALIGGVGFGIFIDELGKFITKDNNYFFRPTIGLIYAIFIILYLAFNFIGRRSKLTHREYELNALAQFEEAVLQDLDPVEKRQIARLLAAADHRSPVVRELEGLLAGIETVPAEGPHVWQRFLRRADRAYDRFWELHYSHRVVGLVFVVQAGIFILAVLATIYNNFDTIPQLFASRDSYSTRLLIGQLASSVVAAAFTIVGATRLLSSRAEAFEMFRRALLVNLLLTEFFLFARIQFGAMPSFLVNLGLLAALRYGLTEEERRRLA